MACSTSRCGIGALRGKRLEVARPLLDIRSERGQLGHRRNVNAPVEPGDDLTCVDVRKRRETLRTQPFQKQGAAPRVCAEQPDRAVAAPPAQHEVLVLGCRVGKADLQNGPGSV